MDSQENSENLIVNLDLSAITYNTFLFVSNSLVTIDIGID